METTTVSQDSVAKTIQTTGKYLAQILNAMIMSLVIMLILRLDAKYSTFVELMERRLVSCVVMGLFSANDCLRVIGGTGRAVLKLLTFII